MGGPVQETRFEIGGPDVVWEAFEDEVVVINLESGCYYALDPIGGVLFDLLLQGAAVPEVVGAITDRYEGEPSVMASEIEGFAQRLLSVELLRQRESDAPVTLTPNDAAVVRVPFGPPQMKAYTDMQDLLLLDPIHDTDETGWPTRRDPGGT